MSHDWGYKTAARMSKDMGLSNAPSRVAVKPHTRAPRVAKALPPAPVSPAKGMPKAVDVPGFAKGGAVKNSKPTKGKC